MAWDGTFWVKLRRQLTDEEKTRQLRVDRSASSDVTQDDYLVFAMNDAWLEITNAAYVQRGMLTYGCLFVLVGGVVAAYGAIWCLLKSGAC